MRYWQVGETQPVLSFGSSLSEYDRSACDGDSVIRYDERRTMERLHRGSSQGQDAEFVGWQKTVSGEKFPLYNITAPRHPARGSTVTDETLRRYRLRVPEIPSSAPAQTRWGEKVAELWRRITHNR